MPSAGRKTGRVARHLRRLIGGGGASIPGEGGGTEVAFLSPYIYRGVARSFRRRRDVFIPSPSTG